jgi:hypothetical protein
MAQQVKTVQLNQDKKGKASGDLMEQGVTVLAPGLQKEVEPGQSVRKTLAEANIEIRSDELIRVGREEVHDLERTLEPGEIVTVVRNVQAGGVA